jgi:ABC-type polysaccharide/polyol phosphate transport system ATPase subunit
VRTEPTIRLDNVTKTYRSGIGRARIREMTPPPFDRWLARAFPKWWLRGTFNALEGVSLSVERGSSVGLIGHNGAGKTTTLKLIAGVTAPTAGSVKVTGRIAALIDVVVGFHPELTGRENVFLLGAIHGLTRREMMGRLDPIIDFAQIGELIDTPLKRYSSGMVSRLGFAVIAQLDTEILLIDEVLAVGDANFQNKCIRWLDGYRSRGGTLIFVSHNLALVRNMTDRAVWFDHGHVIDDGPTATIIPEYNAAMERRTETAGEVEAVGKAQKRSRVSREMAARGLNRWGAGGARLEAVHVGQPETNGSGQPRVTVEVTYEVNDTHEAVFCVGFVDEHGNPVGVANSPAIALDVDKGSLECTIEPLPLKSGVYFPVVAIMSPDGTVEDHWKLERALLIDRGEETATNGLGLVEISSTWSG